MSDVSDAGNLMPIGRFARSCRLSIKALRHYDAEGLLAPAHIDPSSGYRYYARSQARDAILIAMLRSLGVGVPTIRAILRAGNSGVNLLETEIARLEREIAQRGEAIRSLRRVVEARDPFPYDVQVRTEPSVLVAQRPIATSPDRLIPDTTDAIYGLLGAIRDAGRAILMPVLCMNEYDDSEDRITVYCCAAVEPPAPKIAAAQIIELEGGNVASLMHCGPYEELAVAYHTLYAWVQERGHDETGLVREVYHNDPAHVDASELLTELVLPIR